MPLFSLNKIAALAGSRRVYLRGVDLYSAGGVEEFARHSDGEYAERLTARVRDRAAADTYAVELDLNAAGDVVYTACDCGAVGVCTHMVATLTYKYYRDMLGGAATAAAPPEKTAAQRMLDAYAHEAQTAIRAAGLPEPVHLYPALHLETPPALTLTVGLPRAHAYRIKDIAQFRRHLQAGEEVTYGATLQFTHHPDAFDTDSRPLLALLTGASGTGAQSKREWPLTPTELDRFFTLYEGQTLPVGGQDARLLTGDPPLSIAVEATDDTVVLRTAAPRFAVGETRLYLLQNDTLYALSPAASSALRGLLGALRDTGGCLVLTRPEWREFCSNTLATVEPFVTFTGAVDQVEACRPLPLTATVYIDQTDRLTLTARLEFHYGSRIYTRAAEEDAEEGVVRDRLGEWRARLAVQREFPAQTPDGLFVRTHTDDSLFTFLTEGLPALSAQVTVYMSDAFRHTRVTTPPRMAVGVRLSAGLLELQMDFGGLDPADLAGVLEAYRARRCYHRLRSGDFFALDDPTWQALTRLSDGLDLTDRDWSAPTVTVPVFRAPFVERVLAESRSLGSTRDEAFRALRDALNAAEERVVPPPAGLSGTLRRYQQTGLSWLRTMEDCGFGGILADDMGLGKTIQIIALLLDAQARGITRPSLVVCPASLVLNWESELQRFAPSLTVRTILGDSDARAAQLATVRDGDVVITSYDLLKRDRDLYAPLTFHYHILDEAQYIKNHQTQNARAVKSIVSAQRFALTGTPIENRLSELWSIFDFLMPGFLFSYAHFRDRFELPIVRDNDTAALESLSLLCRPFVLRRLKKEVLRELPPKTETVLRIPLEEEQRRLYLAAAWQMQRELEDGSLSGQTRLQALTMLTRLRQICCDPALCYENYTGGSAKREAAIDCIRDAVAGGHRVLLFSQFTSMLARLAARLQEEGIAFFTLQGSTPKEKRAAMVNAFNSENGAPPVFLISLRAGGTGLNLTAADVVIHYDPWWNLSVQNQATDRAHRIGQQRPVQVYSLIAQDTVEERILQLQTAKQSLADAVVRTDRLSLASLSNEELLALLRP